MCEEVNWALQNLERSQLTQGDSMKREQTKTYTEEA